MLPLVPSARRLPLRENQKGVHHFDTSFDRGDRWYRSFFPTTATVTRRRRAVGAAFTAEASPYYFFHPLAARRAAAALPTTHFVVMLRDPVERTVSHWAEQTRNGVETLPLADALAAEPTRLADSEQELAAGRLDISHAHEQQSYAAQSHYTASMQRWFDAVGRDRLTVLFSEDYYRNPSSVLATITDAIGIEPIDDSTTSTHRNAAPRSSELDADLEARLIDRFAPDVAALASLLGTTPPWPRFQSGAVPDDEPS